MKCSQFRTLLFISFVIAVHAQNSTYCPPGFDCLSAQICSGVPIKCSPGMWCPGGYNVGELCLSKHYCETPAEMETCPEGSFCRTAFLEPKECSELSPCPEGTLRQHQFDYLVILIAAFVALFGSFGMYERVKDKFFSSEPMQEIELPEVTPSPPSKKEAFAPSNPIATALDTNTSLNLRFEDLGLVIPSKKGDRMILAGVSGEFKCGSVSAIMGPSGAGKTTLMSVLSGKVKNTSGKVFVNGREDTVSNYKELVGYVPQEDVMIRTLRVREVLEHSARIRLPSSFSDKQRMELVNDVLKLLKLDHVADSVIGDAESRGVSGGERKRVNIGMELVSVPKLLFLDEPTTGLDSNTSKEIMAFLRLIAEQGITVVMVIHQPRYEILQMCDDLLLLAKGGRTVYMGPTAEALDYFADAGFPCPSHFNPADWYMDVISGKISPKLAEEDNIPTLKTTSDVSVVVDKTILFDSTVLVDLWASKAPKEASNTSAGYVTKRDTPGFFAQFGWFLYRNVLQLLRNKKGLTLEIIYQVVTGVAMAMAGISNEMYMPPLPDNMVEMCPDVIRGRCQTEAIRNGVPITMFFMTMTAGVSSSVAANRTFGEEKDVYFREAGSGMNTVAYFLSKCMFDLYSIARNAFILLSFYVLICDPPGTFAGWFGGMFFLMFASYGMGYFFSNLLPPAEAYVVSIVAAVAWSVTSGLSPTLTQLEDYGPLQFFWWISYCRWGAEALYVNVVDDWSEYMRVTNSSGYHQDNYGMDLAMMFVIGIAWRIAAYLAMKYKNKDKQK